MSACGDQPNPRSLAASQATSQRIDVSQTAKPRRRVGRISGRIGEEDFPAVPVGAGELEHTGIHRRPGGEDRLDEGKRWNTR